MDYNITEATVEPDSELGRPISTQWLLKFTVPTMLATVFMSAFGIIDGIFAARVINPAAFAAVGIVMPVMTFAMAIGFMLAIGGSALVAKQLGEGQRQQARETFTMFTIVIFTVSALIAIVGLVIPDILLDILGVDELLRPMALEYLRPILIILPFGMLSTYFQQFFISEGKPAYGTIFTVIGGLVSLAGNFLFIWHLGWGLRGAALATGLGWAIPALFGLIFFARNRAGVLRFVRPTWDLAALGKGAVNGTSEMVTMMAGTITTVVMNNILIRQIGYEAVAAVGIMMAGQMLLMATFMGYATGISPVISYTFGKSDTNRLQTLFRRSLAIIAIASVTSAVLGWFLASPLTRIYVAPGTPLYDLSVLAFRFGLIGFLFMGINGFASVMFTALNNGLISGLLSILRTLVFVLVMLSILPAILEANGVWLALPAAELLALGTSLFAFWKFKGKYQYA